MSGKPAIAAAWTRVGTSFTGSSRPRKTTGYGRGSAAGTGDRSGQSAGSIGVGDHDNFVRPGMPAQARRDGWRRTTTGPLPCRPRGATSRCTGQCHRGSAASSGSTAPSGRRPAPGEPTANAAAALACMRKLSTVVGRRSRTSRTSRATTATSRGPAASSAVVRTPADRRSSAVGPHVDRQATSTSTDSARSRTASSRTTVGVPPRSRSVFNSSRRGDITHESTRLASPSTGDAKVG